MPSIRLTWVLALGVAVATPALAGTTHVRRDLSRRPVHEAAPIAQAPLQGVWTLGASPRIVRPIQADRSVVTPTREKAPIALGSSGAVALLEVEPSPSTRPPAGFTAMLDQDEQPAGLLNMGARQQKKLMVLGESVRVVPSVTPGGTR